MANIEDVWRCREIALCCKFFYLDINVLAAVSGWFSVDAGAG